MARLLSGLLSFLLFILSIAASGSGAMLELRSDRDLTALRIGEQATISASLVGLEAPNALDSLFVAVTYDDQFIEASEVTTGPIVPSPQAEPEDFLASVEDGIIDVAFSTFSIDPAHHITSPGTFIEFQIRGFAEGSGQLSLDFVFASLFNPIDPTEPIDSAIEVGRPLNITVTAVPEPATVTFLVSSFLACAVLRRLR
jgi:hypothetical protein